MFFDTWAAVFRVLAVGVLAYFTLIILLRIAGKRTLSKWNAFDFVVTIVISSILASIVLSKDVSLAEGFAALGLFVGLQFVLTWLSVRFEAVKSLIKAEPTLLLDKGKFLTEAMNNQHVDQSEIRAAIRASGGAAVEDIEAVVLEADGSLSVIKKSPDGSRTALADVGN